MENLLKPHSCVLPVECLQQGQGSGVRTRGFAFLTALQVTLVLRSGDHTGSNADLGPSY